MNKNNKHISEI